jgi:potassium-dependent mechanosensitive channel
MNKSVLKTIIIPALFLFFILTGSNSTAQLPIFDRISNNKALNDSGSVDKLISLGEINKEIEITDNLILKRNYSESALEKQREIIQTVDSFNVYIAKQGKEFRKFELNNLSHFFLNNARVSWNEYYKTLRDHQGNIQKLIRDIQDQQYYYIINKERWEKSLPSLDKSLSDQIIQHISSNIQKMNEIIAIYDLNIRNLITAENKVVQDIFYVDAIINDINHFNAKRKSELFKQTGENIFTAKYRDSFTGSMGERLKLAFHENTKTFNYFFSTVKNNIIRYLLIISLLVYALFFIRKKFIQITNKEDVIDYRVIERVIIKKPVLTAISMAMFLWTIIIPYSPIFLSLFLYLATLVIILRILSPLMNHFIKRIMVIAIILLAISNFEILAWYFGNYSRFYLLLEALTGIYLTYEYILPRYKIEGIKTHNKKRIFYTRIITFLLFVLYSIALISNITGYVNLCIYSLKLGVYTAVFSLLVINLARIFDCFFEASIEVLNLYYPELVKKHGAIILDKMKVFLRIFLAWLWLVVILRIAEFYNYIIDKIGSILTDKVTVGSLSFTLGNVILFVLIISGTYYIAKFVKVIFEREILSRKNLKRGLAASISLTIRIIIVFFGTLLALSFSGLDFGKIGLIAGALSVGIGFGLQNVVSNFISGLILIYEKPVQEGDTVEVDMLLGRVSNIGIRSSTITTYDGAEVVVPNSNLISNQLINWTLSDNRKRVEIKVGTSYNSNPHQVLQLLLEAALSNERVLRDPEPRALFVGFGDNSLNFRLLFWVHFEEGLSAQSDVALKIFDFLKENNIEIPFPQLDLHIKNAKGNTTKNEAPQSSPNFNV